MRDEIKARLEVLARRAGLSGVSPAVLGVALAVLAVAVCLGIWRWWPDVPAGSTRNPDAGVLLTEGGSATTSAPLTGASAVATNAARDASTKLWVHIVGAVRHPGLYRLDAGSRVESAVEAAGGFLGHAAPEGVNLARPLRDGEQLIVPTADEFAHGGGAVAGAGSAVAGSTLGGQGAAGVPVDINSATAEQFDTLPGIGPATATKIVADREAHGAFTSVDDLGRVAGIGPKKLDDLKALVVAN